MKRTRDSNEPSRPTRDAAGQARQIVRDIDIDDEGFALAEIVAARPELDDRDAAETDGDIALIRSWLGNLYERERFVLRCRYGLDGSQPMSLKDVARCLGMSKERVRQIQMHATAKLRHACTGREPGSLERF